MACPAVQPAAVAGAEADQQAAEGQQAHDPGGQVVEERRQQARLHGDAHLLEAVAGRVGHLNGRGVGEQHAADQTTQHQAQGQHQRPAFLFPVVTQARWFQ